MARVWSGVIFTPTGEDLFWEIVLKQFVCALSFSNFSIQ